MPRKNGFTVLEIVVTASLVVLIVTAAAGAWQLYLKISNQSAGLTEAALIAEEGGEALSLMRDLSWTDNIASLTVGTPYYLNWTGSAYAISATPVVIQGKYTRQVTFSSVSRDATTYNISGSGSTDPDTRDAMISVYYNGSSQPIVQSEILIHNVFKN